MHSYDISFAINHMLKNVLILVLMEDALVPPYWQTHSGGIHSLNPCFNGRCTRTYKEIFEQIENLSLNPCFNGRCTRTST